jgi:hypothetical protein
MLRKILNFGVVLPHTVYNLYEISQLVWTQIMHGINFLKNVCI